TDKGVEVLAKETGNARFAYDSYRRFIMMFSDVVKGIPSSDFNGILDELKDEKGVELDTELTEKDLKELVARYEAHYEDVMGEEFPQDPRTQLIDSVTAVFSSWDNPRANIYRRLNDIPSSWGTAVNVQEMVFGNKGDTSGSGVAFSRNPATGEHEVFAEYLMNAQGEDVVAGIRTPRPISELETEFPEIYEEFVGLLEKLENHYKDMQDIEFTIEEEKLYFLQTRNGKRTAHAALKIAVDMVEEGLITKDEALLMIDPKQLDNVLHPAFDEQAMKDAKELAVGLPASPGAATGKIAFTAADAKARHDAGERVMLVRQETSPEDIEGMIAAEGILTVRGGMTSHAAVVARGMGTPCVVGAESLRINSENKTLIANGEVYGEDDYISLEGATGSIYLGEIDTVDPEISGYFGTFMEWADEKRSLKIRTNADTPHDAQQALDFGAEGIGLTRTEHMFFAEDRLFPMRQMIMATNEEDRRKALAKILPLQKEDFKGIYETMDGKAVTIRFLDPPLHEFLPTKQSEIKELAEELEVSVEYLNDVVDDLHEFNPMMGHRGCRLSISYPEVAEMQTRAVIEAAIEVNKEKGLTIIPEIMIPLIGDVNELTYLKAVVTETADKIIADSGVDLKYLVGTMIEIPRACVLADEIALEADFFSFGTNDLTQMGFGFSRDDAGSFLKDYQDKKVYDFDPFAKFDQEGIGQFVKIAVEKGRKAKPELDLGVCGEHGGDPSSIEFFHNVGLDYVSCSPFRVPVARLAAAQAEIRNPRKK
ncbi:MAG: pyruvate, phosphate dikinase, partial [Clostridium sp.]|nr:pyruvate, phosphate dikinase [Clostridium sp.]